MSKAFVFRVNKGEGLPKIVPILPSPTPTITPSIPASPTPTQTPTITPTISITPTITPTISITPTITPTNSPTSTPPPSPSITPTLTPTTTITPTITLTPTTTPTPTPLVYLYGPFKNMIIKAEWDNTGSADADMEMSVKSSGYTGIKVGYCPPTTTVSDSLSWGGDSKGDGYEYFAVDFNALSSISTSTDPITLGLSGNWYTALHPSTINITYTTYVSGNITKSGVTFVSDAATYKQTYTRTYSLTNEGCIDKEFLQNLVYYVNQNRVLIV